MLHATLAASSPGPQQHGSEVEPLAGSHPLATRVSLGIDYWQGSHQDRKVIQVAVETIAS